jgi:hypothetical protein
MEVQSLKQRYGKNTFLVARPAGAPRPVAKAALHATFESLFRGSGCHEDSTHLGWFVDVGADDDEVLALASSVACGVYALDPKVDDVRALEMTRCMNEEPLRPFAVFQMNATDVSDAAALSEILSQDASESYHHQQQASLLGERKPSMLNAARRAVDVNSPEPQQQQQQQQEVQQLQSIAPSKEEPVQGGDRVDNSSKATPANATLAELLNGSQAAPPQRGVTLDSLFMRPGPPNASGSVSVLDSEGMSFAVDRIAVLKVTPRGEGDASLKALHGARQLLESGRVKCMVTEMSFDLNTTEELISFFAELEQLGFHFAHLGSLDYSELEITDSGSYPAFLTDSKQLQELFDTYKRIRSFDERSGFRVYSGSLSLDRNGNYFDYSDLIFACREGFPRRFAVEAKGSIRFKNGVWWIEKR